MLRAVATEVSQRPCLHGTFSTEWETHIKQISKYTGSIVRGDNKCPEKKQSREQNNRRCHVVREGQSEEVAFKQQA